MNQNSNLAPRLEGIKTKELTSRLRDEQLISFVSFPPYLGAMLEFLDIENDLLAKILTRLFDSRSRLSYNHFSVDCLQSFRRPCGGLFVENAVDNVFQCVIVSLVPKP